MSVLDDFVRIRRLRNRAAEFRQLADTDLAPDVRDRYLTIAQHYDALADAEQRSEQAKVAEHLERLRLNRELSEKPQS
jgi:hypothetical protein